MFFLYILYHKAVYLSRGFAKKLEKISRPGGPARHRPRPSLGYPRSVHTHFQGLCVVFGLLSYIPSARLTEQLAFPPLRLCESAESDLITSVVRGEPVAVLGGAPSHTSGFPSYTYIIPQNLRFVKGFGENFSKNFPKVPRIYCLIVSGVATRYASRTYYSPLDTYIISQPTEKVNPFRGKILHEITPRGHRFFVQVAGPAPGQKSGPRHVRKRGSMRPSLLSIQSLHLFRV